MVSGNKKERWVEKWNLYKRKLIQAIRNYKQIRTAFYIIFGIVFIGGYAFFLNSNQLFSKNKVTILASPFDYEYQLEGRKIKIVRWDYADSQDRCEVELDVTDTVFDNQSYSVTCMDRQKGKLNTNIVLQEPDLMIIQVDQIPDDFAELSLQITLNGQVLKLYGTRDSVTHVKNLDILSPTEYKVKRLKLQIERYEKEIADRQDSITEAKEQIQRCEEEKAVLLEKIPLQTEEQKGETELVIESADSQIERANENIKECEEDIAEYQELITSTQQKIDTFQ